MYLKYVCIDVFTDTSFSGNQLAVVLGGEKLNSSLMQSIAREFNYSETVFLLKPHDLRANYRVRIFTPQREIPFAGHPLVGTAYAAVWEEVIGVAEPKTTILQETGIGILPVEIYFRNGRVEMVTITHGKPKLLDMVENTRSIARALGLPTDSLGIKDLKPQIVSTGLKQLIVPAKNIDSVEKCSPNFSLVKKLENKLNITGILIFTLEAKYSDCLAHARFFAPSVGVYEDPATGSAAGCLGAYLVKHKAIDTSKQPVSFIIEQGVEMNRPSKIYVEVEHSDTEPVTVKVGGNAVKIMEGRIVIED